MIDEKNESEGYISNVTGSLYADISNDGKVIFSLFQNGGYKISILDKSVFINDNFIGYDKNYFLNNRGLAPPITKINNTIAKKYEDQFPNMFIMPKLMYDYGTLKPGFYFNQVKLLIDFHCLEKLPLIILKMLIICLDWISEDFTKLYF